MHLTLRRLGPKSDREKTARIIHSAQRTCTCFAWFPILTKSEHFTVVHTEEEEVWKGRRRRERKEERI